MSDEDWVLLELEVKYQFSRNEGEWLPTKSGFFMLYMTY